MRVERRTNRIKIAKKKPKKKKIKGQCYISHMRKLQENTGGEVGVAGRGLVGLRRAGIRLEIKLA